MFVNPKLCIWGLILLGGLTGAVNYYDRPNRVALHREFAVRRINEILGDSTKRYRPYGAKILIKDSETAINIAEPLLFGAFGEEKIHHERPYGVFQIGEYWFLSGSLRGRYDRGGGFEIIIDSRDARVISLGHYK
ncbi:NTF2 fold immunity protein [Chryseolinea sp. T2]|uniref:NTF2 fold immunity protein n=1 Tax=Chryseolinea sp. T2 TaxID=3129255 RepID=UPI003076BBA4